VIIGGVPQEHAPFAFRRELDSVLKCVGKPK